MYITMATDYWVEEFAEHGNQNIRYVFIAGIP